MTEEERMEQQQGGGGDGQPIVQLQVCEGHLSHRLHSDEP